MRRNIDAKPQFTGNILLKGFAVSGISTKPLNRWIGLKCFFRSPNSCLGIMYIGSINYHCQQITHSIHYNVPFASFCFFLHQSRVLLRQRWFLRFASL